MEGMPPYSPKNVDEVFNDFRGRRAALIKALTTDVDKFYKQCDPDLENMCLYGHPNEAWEVNLPVDEVPSELPEPALGINFARDGMNQKDWLSLVAVHSDSWLLSVAFYLGARFNFQKIERKKLFRMINDLPTCYEVLLGYLKQPKDKSSAKSQQSEYYAKAAKRPIPPREEENDEDDEEEEYDDDEQAAICGACEDNNAADEFWICCDVCETWFHGTCVKITPAKAAHINEYKCPGCTTKRSRV